MSVRRTLVLLFALLALAGGALTCGREPAPTPTPPGPTPTPRPLRAPGWEGVMAHTVCLEVSQSYPESEGKAPEPIAEAVQDILSDIGVQVVDEGEPCDAVLTLALTCEPIAAEYVRWGECHSGAAASGELLFTAPDREQLALPLAGRYPAPYTITHCPGPSDAPFEYAWTDALLRGLAHLWGPQILIQALEEGTAWEREVAPKALSEFGPEAVEAVPALIEALESTGDDVRRAAAEAMLEIAPEAGAVEAIPALIKALGDEQLNVRGCAAEALGMFGPEAAEAVPALIQTLEDERAPVRMAAAQALGRIESGTSEAVPALIQALDDEDKDVRRWAWLALRFITDQEFDQDAAAWQEWWEAQQP
jgi:hypothetical protein